MKALAAIDHQHLAGNGGAGNQIVHRGDHIGRPHSSAKRVAVVHRPEVLLALAGRFQHQGRSDSVHPDSDASKRARSDFREPGECLLRKSITQEIRIGRAELGIQEIDDQRVAAGMARSQRLGQKHRRANIRIHVCVKFVNAEGFEIIPRETSSIIDQQPNLRQPFARSKDTLRTPDVAEVRDRFDDSPRKLGIVAADVTHDRPAAVDEGGGDMRPHPFPGSGDDRGAFRWHYGEDTRIADCVKLDLPNRLRSALQAPEKEPPLEGDLQELREQAAVPAAVLIPVTNRAEPGVIFTVRREHLRRHAGQIALPGGRAEAGETPVEAAVRESFEELGLEPSKVEIVGELAEYRTVTGYVITPVIGVLPPDLQLQPHQDEVASWFEAPLEYVLDPANQKLESAVFGGLERHYWVIEWQGKRIWGATAAILVNLARRLQWNG